MKNQLIPPPELAPPSMRHLSPEQKVAVWAQMVDEGDELVMAGLRRRIGPNGDVQAEFLKWVERRDAEHDRMIVRMITEMRRREREYAG